MKSTHGTDDDVVLDEDDPSFYFHKLTENIQSIKDYVWTDFEKMRKSIRIFGQREYVTVTDRSCREKTVKYPNFLCNRGGTPKERTNVKRESSSIVCGCEWKVLGKQIDNGFMINTEKSILSHTNGCNPTKEQFRTTNLASGEGRRLPENVMDKLETLVVANAGTKQYRTLLAAHPQIDFDLNAQVIFNIRSRLAVAQNKGLIALNGSALFNEEDRISDYYE